MKDYESIKAWARESKRRVTELIALAPQNDPFYTGTPGDVRNGEWFAKLWEKFGYHGGVHVRRVHYQIVSQDPPVRTPNGEPYANTERCWRFLNAASKSARYLNLVDPEAFTDRRNPHPTLLAKGDSHPHLAVAPREEVEEFSLPEFPELPSYELTEFSGRQRYLIEVWCEKSTMNDVLLPLCEEYEVNLVTGVGELSITAVLDLVLHRIKHARKPTRILYVSDFDPAGVSMPVAVSRKIEYFVRSEEMDLDVRLHPAALMEDQVRKYRLPRTPIKESERRKSHFEDLHGRGATELDALEALHPGTLRAILEAEIRRYYDTGLEERTERALEEIEERLAGIELFVRGAHESELTALREEYEELRSEFAERAKSWSERMLKLHGELHTKLQEAKPDLKEFPVPEGEPADEAPWVLYDSRLDYEAQLERYKAFQSGQAAQVSDGAGDEAEDTDGHGRAQTDTDG